MCLLADRFARAYTEFRREEEDKASLVTEETEARAARSARERAAEGDCIICFSEKPNIATLCCGKAVHLNCIAEWLGSNTSCPQCRATIPRLQTTTAPAPSNQADTESVDGSTFSDSTAIPRLQTTTAPAPSNQADTESVDGSTFSDSTAVDHDHDERRTRQPKAAGIQIQSN